MRNNRNKKTKQKITAYDIPSNVIFIAVKRKMSYEDN